MVTVGVKQEEEGMCTSDLFSEDGMIGLLEQATFLFTEVHAMDNLPNLFNSMF